MLKPRLEIATPGGKLTIGILLAFRCCRLLIFLLLLLPPLLLPDTIPVFQETISFPRDPVENLRENISLQLSRACRVGLHSWTRSVRRDSRDQILSLFEGHKGSKIPCVSAVVTRGEDGEETLLEPHVPTIQFTLVAPDQKGHPGQLHPLVGVGLPKHHTCPSTTRDCVRAFDRADIVCGVRPQDLLHERA